MTHIDLVNKYMDIVFYGKDYKKLNSLLSDNCKFVGPFYQFNNSNEYINSLLNDPPKQFNFEILKTYEENDSVCLIYKFYKPGISTTMAQIFEIEESRISSIQLIFDTQQFIDI